MAEEDGGRGAAMTPERMRLRRGFLIALCGAVSLGFISPFARLAYDAGSDPPSLITVRFASAVVVALVIARLQRRPLVVPRHLWRPLALVALGALGVPVGYLTAIAYIPVSLSALVFYSYPLIVALLSAGLGMAAMGPLRWLAFLIAFAGLALVLAPDLASLDPRGLALAFLAAVSATLIFIVSPRVMGEGDVIVLTGVLSLLCLVVMLAAVSLTSGFRFPAHAPGWLAFAGANLCFVVGQLAVFFSLKEAGAAPAAMVFNLEPLVTLAAAAGLLGERLGTLQMAGAALVIAALLLFARRQLRI